MQNLKTILKRKLKAADRIAVLGIGSELRGDDIAGMLVADSLRKFKDKNKKLKVLLGATAPENLTGEIKKFKPSHVIIIDAADIGKKPGALACIDPEEIDKISFSTHQLPLSIMAEYLTQSLNCKIIVIGIQPKTIKFGFKFSKEIEKSAAYLSDTIKEIISGN